MKIAVINEVSARVKNGFVVKALEDKGFEVLNLGMTEGEIKGKELTYIHTGLMAAVILNLGAADFVVGGCGTGQGFMISAMQYPSVFCGLIDNPLDAWLFGQINGGNCVSLALNKGFGWAGDINLRHIFDKFFSDGFGQGYPKQRQQSQQASRQKLFELSQKTHKSMEEILTSMDKEITDTVFGHKPFADAVRGDCENEALQRFIINKFLGG
jgi:ribose 5-phosphate isomerase RpiB